MQDENKLSDGTKIRSEDIGFDASEMAVCPKCGKSNPPNRTNCFYCAAEFDVSGADAKSLKIDLHPLENWENGSNVVFVPPAQAADISTAALYLKQDRDVVEKLLSASSPLPIARLASAAHAELARSALADAGVPTTIVSDIDLKIGKPNVRLRSVVFEDSLTEFAAFNTGERIRIGYDEIALIVVGKLVESRSESIEKGRKGKRKVISGSDTAADEAVVDVYANMDGPGWRILTKGFDFSGLGERKELIAAENIRLLTEELAARSADAKVIKEYGEMRTALSSIWAEESHRDFEGMKRTGIWRAGFSSVVTTSNLDQFSRYSRLQRILL